MIRRICIAITALALLLFGACSESNEVGSGVQVDPNAGGGINRLGVTTTTAAPVSPESTVAPVATTPTQPVQTTAPRQAAVTSPPPTTAPPAAAPAFEITINGDSSGQKQFEPPQAAVRKGTLVRWINRDSVPRIVESEEAGFQSPSIPPGGAFEYKTEQTGTFNYQDGTRPYAVGVLQVG